jgi:hypothetical protein
MQRAPLVNGANKSFITASPYAVIESIRLEPDLCLGKWQRPVARWEHLKLGSVYCALNQHFPLPRCGRALDRLDEGKRAEAFPARD